MMTPESGLAGGATGEYTISYPYSDLTQYLSASIIITIADTPLDTAYFKITAPPIYIAANSWKITVQNLSEDPASWSMGAVWILVGPMGPQGSTGSQGATGNQGATGEKGDGVQLLGSYSSLSALQTAHPTANVGDSYAAGGNIYTWSGDAWVDQGPLGIKGDTGAQGATGATGADGVTGAQGATGADGVTGSQGATGADGVTGSQGAGVQLLGSYSSLPALRTAHPTANVGDSYAAGERIYTWSGSEWVDQGPVGANVVLSDRQVPFYVNGVGLTGAGTLVYNYNTCRLAIGATGIYEKGGLRLSDPGTNNSGLLLGSLSRIQTETSGTLGGPTAIQNTWTTSSTIQEFFGYLGYLFSTRFVPAKTSIYLNGRREDIDDSELLNPKYVNAYIYVSLYEQATVSFGSTNGFYTLTMVGPNLKLRDPNNNIINETNISDPMTIEIFRTTTFIQIKGASGVNTVPTIAIGTFYDTITDYLSIYNPSASDNYSTIGFNNFKVYEVISSIGTSLDVAGGAILRNTVTMQGLVDLSSATTPLTYNTSTGVVSYNTSKTFIIDHPTRADSYLVHAALEGPEAGVYYRGKDVIVHDASSITISLPNYVSALAYDFTVNITPIYNGGTIGAYAASEVVGGQFTVYGPPGKFSWVVLASRQDIAAEVKKDSVRVCGEGPYRYIS